MNRKSLSLLVVGLASTAFITLRLDARPVDLSIPGGGFGSASADGTATHWLELAELDFGDGLSLPLRLSFDSGRVGGATDLGKGSVWWRAPELHARIMARTAAAVTILLPCGRTLTMDAVPGVPDQFSTPDGEWIGTFVKEALIVSREDGWELEYAPTKWLVRLRNDDNRTVFYNRAPNGQLISMTENDPAKPDGQVKTTGLLVKRDPATGNVTAFDALSSTGLKTFTLAYDGQQRLTSVAFPDGTTERYSYEPAMDGSPQITILSREAVKTAFAWNKDNGTLVSDGIWAYEVKPQQGSYPKITRVGPGGETEISWDDSRKSGTVTFTAADGTTTIRQMVKSGPAKGKLDTISRLYAGSKEPVFTYKASYDGRGMLTDEWDAMNRKTSHSYVLFGGTRHVLVSKHTKTNPLGHATIEEFDKHGNLTASTDALGNVTRHTYDRRNRRISTIGPDGTVTEKISYNRQNKIESRTDAAGNVTRYGYDKEGNVATITDALGGITTDTFDARGNKITTTDPLGRTWKFEHDAGGRLIRTLDPEGKETSRRAYDDQGRITAITDGAGNTSRTTYDLFGRITARIDALERVTKYSYDVRKGATGCTACNASAMPTRITLPSGRVTERVYDADRRLIAESNGGVSPPVSAAGAKKLNQTVTSATTRYTYDLAGNVTSITDPLGRVTTFEYDAGNNRTKTINPDRTARIFKHDAAGHIIAETDENGAITKRAFDAYGNLASTTDAAGGVTRILFEDTGSAALHRSTGILSAAGVRTDVRFDALGRRIAEIKGAASREAAQEALKSEIPNPKSAIAITRHEYDAVGNEIRAVSPTGKVTTHEYDARNRRILTAEPLGRVWKFVHADNAGPSGPAPCCGADPGSNSKAIETILPDGAKESRVLDAAGQLVKTTDAKGDSIAYAYDPDGRLETLTDAKGNVTRWTYDARGKLAAKIYPDKTLELYEHDAAGQMIRRTRPDGTGAAYVYDMRGKLTSIKWDGDKAEPSTFAYDPAGRMILAKNLSSTVQREYDARGKIAKETQLIVGVPPLGGQKDVRSPKASDSKSKASEPPKGGTPTNTSSYTVAYQHNADGQLHSLTYPDGTIITYLYNSRGELAEVTDSSSLLQAPGSMLPRSLATYERRANGTIAKLTLANGLVTTRTYDAAGRLSEIAHTDTNGKVLESEASRYDTRDRRTARIKADGTADLFSYDPAGQVVAAAYGQASNVIPPLRPPNESPTNSSPVNPANPANPVKKEASASSDPKTEKDGFTPTQTFAYDAAGNRLKTTDHDQTTEYKANANNQYTAIAENGAQHEPDYDKSGNLLHDATRKFTWDADIHLLSVETQSDPNAVRQTAASSPKGSEEHQIGNPKSAIKESFRYDALHRRVSRTESSSQLATFFIHDGWNVIAEYSVSHPNNRSTTAQPSLNNSKPALAARHIWSEDLSRTLQGAGGIGGLLSSTHFIQPSPTTANNRQPPQTLFFGYDSNGNVILLTDSHGFITAKYRYDAFGKTISATGIAANLNRYRFATKPVDFGCGMAFFGYRFYDSSFGRWPSKDPIGVRGGINTYAAGLNSLLTLHDYLGLTPYPGTQCCVKSLKATESAGNNHVGDGSLAFGFFVEAIYADSSERVGGGNCGVSCNPSRCQFRQMINPVVTNITGGYSVLNFVNSRGQNMNCGQWNDDGYSNSSDQDPTLTRFYMGDAPQVGGAAAGTTWTITMSFRAEVYDALSFEVVASTTYGLTFQADGNQVSLTSSYGFQ